MLLEVCGRHVADGLLGRAGLSAVAYTGHPTRIPLERLFENEMYAVFSFPLEAFHRRALKSPTGPSMTADGIETESHAKEFRIGARIERQYV